MHVWEAMWIGSMKKGKCVGDELVYGLRCWLELIGWVGVVCERNG